MIYSLPFESEELLKTEFFRLRSKVNPKNDIIHLIVNKDNKTDAQEEDLFKKILKFEGAFRTETGSWLSPPARVRLLRQF